MGIHDGHRQRVYDRLRKEGLDSFSPHNVLELLLFYSIPRADTNEIAHRLIDRFGSVAAVLDAPESELVKVSGIGEHSATLIKLIPQLARYYMTDKTADIIIGSSRQAGEYLLPRYVGRSVETVMMVCLDNKNKVINTTIVHEGSVNVSEVSVQAIASVALQSKASAVILAHNHPDGVALPSNDDIATTKVICRSLGLLSIRMIDHIIIGDNDYVSLADTGRI
ncbi:MAG: DNA repair protein RadC [Clostridia bacterium]|nr:DNA repair protein RadC [Clostridia bacterium]MBR4955877.1 DNA repair protein RadC [Clostridia bacterium]